MSNYGKMMKQAARMQQQIAEAQANVLKLTAEGASGGGAVKVVARGDSSIASIKIDPQVFAGGDASMLEDMVLSASNQALDKVRELANAEMSKATAGISIPGLM
ncbi:MAG: YbaB/EbfC family nucleoid-associated protein [Verrucomicrobia bacterium]|nr:YbaB/EbfC family nucleoid-associated protein [Verrucomicrobiota bacterium]MBI3869933.1 YbaB/EbfC family nucleoid-associated protein [Verrucomicrobiota bacterium]